MTKYNQLLLGPTVFHGKFCQIPRLNMAKLLKFRGLARPSVCA